MRHEGPGLARTLVPLAWPPEVPAPSDRLSVTLRLASRVTGERT